MDLLSTSKIVSIIQELPRCGHQAPSAQLLLGLDLNQPSQSTRQLVSSPRFQALINISSISALQNCAGLHQKDLHLLLTPQLWLAVAGPDIHNTPRIPAEPILCGISSPLDYRVLGASSDRYIVELLLHVCEACDLDLGA